MNRTKKQRLNEIFKNSGYNSQVSVARALIESGEYGGKKEETIRAYLCQVLSGGHKASEKLIKGLVKICDEEKIVEIFGIQRAPITRVEYGLKKMFKENFETLFDEFQNADLKERFQMCMDFEDYVKNYKAES